MTGAPAKKNPSEIRVLEPGMYWTSNIPEGISGEWTIISIENGQGWLIPSKLSKSRASYGDIIISAREKAKGRAWVFVKNLPSSSTSPTWAFSLDAESNLSLINHNKSSFSTTHPTIGRVNITFDSPSHGQAYTDDLNCKITFGQTSQIINVAKNCNDSYVKGIAFLDIDGDEKLDLIVCHVGYPGIRHVSLFLSTQAPNGKLVGPAIRVSHGGE